MSGYDNFHGRDKTLSVLEDILAAVNAGTVTPHTPPAKHHPDGSAAGDHE
jgi:hypothetical protein